MNAPQNKNQIIQLNELGKNMTIELTRINNDTNGNPRLVFHYLELADSYSEALHIAKRFGGRKFHNRQFGGGIACQCYNKQDLIKSILENKVN